MELTSHNTYKFNSFLPIYNWLYPLGGTISSKYQGEEAINVFKSVGEAKGRALYFHFPFCETICSFCPFVRAGYKNDDLIESYVNCLINEIELKAKYQSVIRVPIRAIFFGGGTPSLLSPNQIRKIGKVIKKHFDLRELIEFSFEFEVKSVSIDKIEALKEIGVTHARFGLQTFSKKYRDFFALTASIEQVISAKNLLLKNFPFVSCDLMYGMNGQSVEDFTQDIEEACKLNLNNLDFYPINNIVTQHRLHKTYKENGLAPISGLTKFYMNILLRRVMAENGFLPHNGHGFVKVDKDELNHNPIITNKYSFIYHEHVYGFPNLDLLGFGVNAISSFNKFSVFNPSSREGYMKAIKKGQLLMEVKSHGAEIDACRPLCLALPYHGEVKKHWINWSQIPGFLLERFNKLIKADLVYEDKESYKLTQLGWFWYSNIMYYLLPESESLCVDDIVSTAKHSSKKQIESTGLEKLRF